MSTDEKTSMPVWAKVLLGMVPLLVALVTGFFAALPNFTKDKDSNTEPPAQTESVKPGPLEFTSEDAPGLVVEDPESGIRVEQNCPEGEDCGSVEVEDDDGVFRFHKFRPRPDDPKLVHRRGPGALVEEECLPEDGMGVIR